MSSFRYGADATTYQAMLSAGQARAGADLGFGALVEGSLASEDATQGYALALEAGELLDVQTYGHLGLDTRLALLDADGNEIAREDDTGRGSDARLVVMVEDTGRYTLRVAAYGAGSYTLRVGLLDLTPGQGGALAYGERTEGFIINEGGDIWTFQGQVGDVVTIAVDSGLDTTLELYGPNVVPGSGGFPLAENDDSNNSANPLIEGFELPMDGTYSIVVAPFFFDDLGLYTLLLRQDE
ncbi:MAG: hypothetical protein HC915_15765 [Anaerolineae bacterium]|nr:hypothetical protein [Anaerolineae bacterium]